MRQFRFDGYDVWQRPSKRLLFRLPFDSRRKMSPPPSRVAQRIARTVSSFRFTASAAAPAAVWFRRSRISAFSGEINPSRIPSFNAPEALRQTSAPYALPGLILIWPAPPRPPCRGSTSAAAAAASTASPLAGNDRFRESNPAPGSAPASPKSSARAIR